MRKKRTLLAGILCSALLAACTSGGEKEVATYISISMEKAKEAFETPGDYVIDFELYPEEHCLKAPELLREAGVGEDIIHAVCSHGYGIMVGCGVTIDVEPVHEMEKVLFAAGCSREVIARGAEQLGFELDKLLEMTLRAMAASEDTISAEMAAEG